MLRKLHVDAIYPLALVVITIIIAIANYTPGTFLSGWDTLHPEFNFPLAFSRMLTGVWRADQGLGAVAIQSHMADLPRVFFLWLESLVLPLNFLRYSFFFLMLTSGPLGAFFLTRHLLTTHNKSAGAAAFIAGLAYLANLGTVQHFVVPLEMFAAHYGLVPWIFLVVFRVLDTGSRKFFLIFFALTIFVATTAHTATLFYVYLTSLTLTLITYILVSQHKKTLITRSLVIFISTILLNGFWLLPNLYSVALHGAEVRESKVNSLFSGEAFAKNQLFGNFTQAAILKNFLFDWNLLDTPKGQFVPVLGAWQKHLNNPAILTIGYLVFALALTGVLQTLITGHKKTLALIPIFAVSLFMLVSGTWPITLLFENLGNIYPTLKEALRFPFTKFSLLLMLSISVFTGVAIAAFTESLKRVPMVAKSLFCALGIGLLVYFLPAFQGQLIQPAMRIQIPSEYFRMFSWLAGKPQTDRVAILPIHSFWNWIYYDWGYQGAGFLQFGIPQPILDRDYDRWNPANEQYQREMAHAIYSQNPQLIAAVIRKFQIRYILFDTAVISPGNDDNTTLKWLIPTLLAQIPDVREAARFGDHLVIYETGTSAGTPISIYSGLTSIGPRLTGAAIDKAFLQVGPYLTLPSDNVITDHTRGYFRRDERFDGGIRALLLDRIGSHQSERFDPLVSCSLDGKIIGTRQFLTDSIRYASLDGPICDHLGFPNLPHSKGYVVEIVSRNLNGFPLQLCVTNLLTSHCDIFVHLTKQSSFTTERFYLPPLSDFGLGYTLNFNNFAIKNQTSVNEISGVNFYEVDPTAATNDQFLGAAKSQIIDPNLLTISHPNPAYYAIRIELPTASGQPSDSNNQAAGLANNGSTLVLNQSFHPGWTAWMVPPGQLASVFPFLFGTQLKNHVLVNNWANGWILPKTEVRSSEFIVRSNSQNTKHEPSTTNYQPRTIILFFWPQLLQWLGFLLLPLPFRYILLKKNS